MWTSWLNLGEWLGSHPPAPSPATVAPASAADPDELMIVDAQDIRRRLSHLARQGWPVRLQWPSSDDELYGELILNAEQTLSLRLSSSSAPALPPGPINISACSADGLLAFTVLMQGGARVLRCDWPTTVLRMQSRRHFRLPARADPSHPMRLSLSGCPLAPRLLDLSESGLGLQTPLSPAQVQGTYEHARLELGALVLTIPMLHIVHRRPHPEGQGSLLGSELLGLAAEGQREFRRWLLQAQSALARRTQAGVVSTRSKR
ncbi:MAG: PilZ domain-containing protein [Roseateles sp.]